MFQVPEKYIRDIMVSHMPDMPDELPKRIVRSEQPSEEEQGFFQDAAGLFDAHMIPAIFSHLCPSFSGKGSLLDIGCGIGAYTVGWANSFPNLKVTGVDLSEGCIELARQNAQRFGNRPNFVVGRLPGVIDPKMKFDIIVARTSLHFFSNSKDFWAAVAMYAKPNTTIFVLDLVRPRTVLGAKSAVLLGMGKEEPPARRAFYLKAYMAASRFEEIWADLEAVGLKDVRVATEPIGRRIYIFRDGGRSSMGERRVVAPGA